MEILIEELSGKRKIARLLKKSPTATALQFSPLHVRVLERERERKTSKLKVSLGNGDKKIILFLGCFCTECAGGSFT